MSEWKEHDGGPCPDEAIGQRVFLEFGAGRPSYYERGDDAGSLWADVICWRPVSDEPVKTLRDEPAFPRTGEGFGNPNYDAPGMSLRAYIATAAMQGLLASGPHDCDQHGIAHDAILHADALIAALAARKEK